MGTLHRFPVEKAKKVPPIVESTDSTEYYRYFVSYTYISGTSTYRFFDFDIMTFGKPPRGIVREDLVVLQTRLHEICPDRNDIVIRNFNSLNN